MNRSSLIVASTMMFLGVALGAIGAHALEERISDDALDSFETGVRYLIYHGIVLLVLGLNKDRLNFKIRIVNHLFGWGTLLFSGSIFLLATKEIHGIPVKFLGPVTPIGGICLLSGWLGLIILFVNFRIAKHKNG